MAKTTTSRSRTQSGSRPAAKKRPPASRGSSGSTRSRSTARAKRSAAPIVPRLPVLEQRQLDLLGLAFVAAGVFLAFPLYLGWDGGKAGAGLTDGLAWLVGEVRYVAPVALVAAGALLVLRPVLPTMRPFRAGGICLAIALLLSLSAGTFGLGPSGSHGDHYWVRDVFEPRGGIFGEALFYVSATLLGIMGTHLLASVLMLFAVLLLTGGTLGGVLRTSAVAAADTTRALRTVAPAPRALRERIAPPEPEDEEPSVQRPARKPAAKKPRKAQLDGADRFPDLFGPGVEEDAFAPDDLEALEPMAELPEPEAVPLPLPPVLEPAVAAVEEEDEPEEEVELEELPLGEAMADGAEVEWQLPDPMKLDRSPAEDAKPDLRGQQALAAQLIEALAHFNIQAQITGTVSGPHITRYELKLAPGVKMSKVAQMKDDLAYALAATEIRILAPIPGKTAVGVEVPNKIRKLVTLGDVYGAAPKGSSPLTVWLGKDVSGKPIHADLAKMPHLLVAGTTGAGKSGCINAMLSSILLRSTPEEVRLVLVDPKQVELNHYEEVPHLLTPVITSPRAAANALQNLVREMEWRYGIMSVARTRSLVELNKHREANGDEPLPYILCVIDELADLMMVAPADVEDSIIRIAQKARAVGMHLVLATQSPRVDVITGMIKANVPSRIAFAVSSQTDSRVILDQNGAESLLGMGDMLFSAVGSSKLQRIQGAYIDEEQIAALTGFWAEQGEPEIRAELLEEVEPAADEGATDKADDGFDPDEDPLLGEAIALVVEMGTASTSMLQRRLRLGYTRAGRLIDMLERRGVISGYEGSKPRQVLVQPGQLPSVLAALDGTSSAALPDPSLLDDEPTVALPADLGD